MQCGAALAQAAFVVVDGTTDTDVTVAEDGSVLVDIASTTNDGVSINRFERFNVPEAGLAFDNRFVVARTILSEVTGSDPSLIEGAVEVLGASANVILANPNGITVDGGEFINTGGVVLTTGETSFVERQIAPGFLQTNPVFDVSAGTITVGPEGLSGAMEVLHLIAREIRIEGEVNLENESPAAGLFLTAGASTSEFNTSVLPFGNLDQLILIQSTGGSSDGEVLIDIVRTGGLAASRIQALVTDAGAGVRYAGDGLAARGDFTLFADGRVTFEGADIASALALDVDAGEIVALESDRGTQLAAFNADLTLTAERGDISLTDATLFSAEDQDVLLNAVDGGVTLTGTRRDDVQSALIAGGNVTIEAAGSQVFANTDLQVTGDYTSTSADTFEASSSSAVIGGTINIEASDVLFASPQARSEFISVGALNVTAARGSILVDGAILQGGSEDEAIAGVSFSAAGDVLLSSADLERRGVLFAQSGDLSISAGGNVVNASGRLVSNSAIRIDAGGFFDNRLGELTQDSASLDAILQQARDSQSSFELDFGAAPEDGLDAILTAQGDIVIQAGENIRNFGGEFNANAGDIRLDAPEVLIQSRVFGEASYRRSCFIVCRASGSSSVQTVGGLLNASGEVIVTGAGSFLNLGGFVTGLEGVSIDASDITFEALLIPQFISRPGGLYNFFSGSTDILIWRDVLGGVFAGDGSIVLNSDSAVRLIGVTLDEGQVVASAGLDISQQDRTVSPITDQSIGLLSGLGVF